MNDRLDIEIPEHYVVEQATPRWLSTGLTTVGAALVTALLIWIAASQLEINTQQAVILVKLENQQHLYTKQKESVDSRLSLLLDNQNRIWPRLRAHGENLQIVARELEKYCNCDIKLKDPEPY